MDREEYLAMGGLDEDLFLFFNDVDLCRRLWAKGRRIHYLAEAEVMHHQGASTKGHLQFLVTWHRNRRTYYRKHYGRPGVCWLRVVTWLRAVEESIRIAHRTKDRSARRSARRSVWDAYREVWSPRPAETGS